MEKAAIYARRSTPQEGRAEETKSVTRQVELAREFAQKQRWTVSDEHIFVDDGISGAEFKKRPELQQMLAAASEFQFLIVSELKSIGREMFETGATIKQLSEDEVEVFEYMEGKSLTPKNWLEKAMTAIQSAADEGHVADTSRRVHEAHLFKIRKGYWVGGRVFGYCNKNIYSGEDEHGRPLRVGVKLEINELEAVVVRRIFELYDSGYGLKRIAKMLSAEGAPRPKPLNYKSKDRHSPTKWSPSTVGTILKKELYRGIHVWNRTKKRDKDGKVKKKRKIRSPEDVVRTKWEHAKIVSDELWNRVASRREDVSKRTIRFNSGRISGRPPKHAIKNLLAGLATCGICGGGLVVQSSGRKDTKYCYPRYVCWRRRHDKDDCTNTLRMPVDEMNEAVLNAVEEHVLTPEAVENVIQMTEHKDVHDQKESLEREGKNIKRRLEHLVKAIEEGGRADTLVSKIKELEARLNEIKSEITNLAPVPRLEPSIVEDRLAEWRRLMRSSTTQARAVLQRVLQGRLVFTPIGKGYKFEGPTRFDKLFSGIVTPRPDYVQEGDVRGTEHITSEDTLDADYGRVLEKATRSKQRVKGVKPRKGSVPFTAVTGRV